MCDLCGEEEEEEDEEENHDECNGAERKNFENKYERIYTDSISLSQIQAEGQQGIYSYTCVRTVQYSNYLCI